MKKVLKKLIAFLPVIWFIGGGG
ncbi:hypothetical protein CAT7_03684 [Carnobacterium sp. AT7]|nr:hypothetical protein CAT7_03684 [Carnobacterium sp. AT7]